jgi:DNA-binding transcriptional ArsR family regulator
VPGELAWLLDLLTQTARYAEPALAELDASLLPGVKGLRAPVMERSTRLWNDSVPGCPELLLVADQADCVRHDNATRLLAWLTTGGSGPTVTSYELLTEPAADRHTIRARLRRLKEDVGTRRAYRDLIAEVWRLAAPVWETRGRRLAVEACGHWMSRIAAGTSIEDLMPPRHPLTFADRFGFDDIFTERDEFALSPLYFCLSGGQVVDLTDYVHIAVPASDLLPVRKVRDAAFVADRLRVLATPARVHILIQLLSAPAGVMDVARALHMSQPTVSGHLKVLRDAGLVQPRRAAGRTVFIGSRKRIERLLEDARATIARWD